MKKLRDEKAKSPQGTGGETRDDSPSDGRHESLSFLLAQAGDAQSHLDRVVTQAEEDE